MTGARASQLPEVVLRPVRGHHAFEACVEQLATAIRLGSTPAAPRCRPSGDLAERLEVSRATLREAMAALREAGLVETTRGRGGGTVVTLQARHPVRAGRGRGSRTPSGRTGWTRWTSAGSSSPARPSWPRSRSSTATPRAAGAGARRGRRGPRSPAAHRQADSRLHLTIAALHDVAMTIEAVTVGAGDACTTCCRRSRCSRSTSRTPTASTRAIVDGDPRRQARPSARRVMEEHCDDTAALLRGLLG